MSLADESKLLLIPSGYKSGIVYSVFPTDGDGDFTFSRSGNASRVNPGGYIETVGTNIPRIDHTGGGCPSLLLEPTRSNIQIKSEEFQSSFWTKSRTTITSNNAISPDGEFTADKLNGTGTGTSYVYDGNYLSNGFDYTISIFVKPIINIPSFAINVFGGVGTAYFNLVDKTAGSISGDFTSAKIVDYGNGWLRCIGTLTLSSATGTKNIGYGLVNFNGDQFYLFGAQVEQGSYVSSYIKTTSIYSTRQADFCINGGDSSLFNVNELSLFIDAKNFKRDNGTLSYIVLTDGQSTPINMIRIEYKQDRITLAIYSNGSSILGYSVYSVIPDQRNKLLLTFDNNVAKTYFNGALRNTYTSIVIPSGLDSLSFTNRTENAYSFQGEVNDARVYNRVLTEAEAVKLTTL